MPSNSGLQEPNRFSSNTPLARLVHLPSFCTGAIASGLQNVYMATVDTPSDTLPDPPLALPFLTEGAPRIIGSFRQSPDDFRVEEHPSYPPDGHGDHLFVHIEKTGLTTPEAVRRIASALGVDGREAGHAGLKDRHAVARQWVSFFRGDRAQALSLDLPGIRVLAAEHHPHKLRTGHLKANRFTIRLRGADDRQLPAVEAILAVLVRRGLPNYFGPQRFGAGGQNIARARRFIEGGQRPPRDRFQRKLMVSVWQAERFNAVLRHRILHDAFDRPLPGDLLRKEDTGGLFTTDDRDDATQRVADFEISATGPMFGAKMRWPVEDAEALELAVLAERGLEPADLARFARAGEGTRRPLRVAIRDLRATAEDGTISLEFTLPSGAYATALVRELLKHDDHAPAAPGADRRGDGGDGHPMEEPAPAAKAAPDR